MPKLLEEADNPPADLGIWGKSAQPAHSESKVMMMGCSQAIRSFASSPEIKARTAQTTARWRNVIPRLMLLFIVGGLLVDCTIVEQMLPEQRAAAERAEEQRALGLRVMRFADEYAGRVTETLDRVQRTTQRPENRLGLQNWKLSQVAAAYTIASGPKPVTNLLDMVVLAALSRSVTEGSWVIELHGPGARIAQEAHRDLEAAAWQLASKSLTPPQVDQLRTAIDRWRAENPTVHAVAYIHFRDLATALRGAQRDEELDPGNLWAMLGLDPLRQLTPAVREITQTRELAERTIFYMQRAPTLLDMQLERATYQFAVMPETKSLLADLERASLVGPAADRFVTSIPNLMAQEREALLSQLTQTIDDRLETIASLSGEVRSTLQAGTQTANALHAALETLDRVAARFPPEPHDASTGKQSRPFDITEVTQMVRELAVTTRELTDLTQHMDTTLPTIRNETQQAADHFERILDRLLVRLLMFLLAIIAALLIAALVYRSASVHMDWVRSHRHK